MLADMVKRTGNRNANVFTSLFTSSMFIMLVPLSAAIMVAAFFQMAISSQVEKDRQNYSQNINEIVENAFTSASSLTYEISVNNRIVSYARSSSRDYWTEYEILTYLKSSIGNYGDIKSCYIYLPQYDCIISDTLSVTTESFYKRFYGFGYEKWMDGMNISSSASRIRLYPVKDGGGLVAYSHIMRAISQNSSTGRLPVVVIHMNEHVLTQKVKGLKTEHNAKVLVYNDEGVILSTFENDDGREMYEKVKDSSEPGLGTVSVNGKSYQVIKNKTGKYNFTALYAAPRSLTNTSFSNARTLAVAATVFCAVVTIICCIALSKKHSKKVKGILSMMDIEAARNEYSAIETRVREYISNNMALAEEVNRGKDAIQAMYLERLLCGNVQDEKGIEKYLEQYGIVMTGEYFAVALYAINNSQALFDDDGVIDGAVSADTAGCSESLAKTILEEAFSRLLSSGEAYYIIDLEKYIVCILNFPDSTPEQRSSCLNGLVDESTKILNDLQQNEYTAFVSHIHQSALKLKDAYAEALRAMNIHEGCGHGGDMVKIQPDWVGECIRIIEQNYHDINLSTSYIADRLNLARPYMSSTFKQYTGTGLHDKILEYRIMMARKMMQENPEILIMDVAKKTGFNNVASFIRSFKKLEGVTPGEIRTHLENDRNS